MIARVLKKTKTKKTKKQKRKENVNRFQINTYFDDIMNSPVLFVTVLELLINLK